MSVDEKTGIQALERIAPTKPTQPGRIKQIEFDYKRHGTVALMAGINISSGLVYGQCFDSRNEKDFASFINAVISDHPMKKYHFVVDNLNTHKSESLVKIIAKKDGVDIKELGEKRFSGILKTMTTREAFLSNPDNSIVFHYTPKHASWINQIECWFSILVRKVIKKGNFNSIQDLKTKIVQFIDYFNETMAKPIKWKFKGFQS